VAPHLRVAAAALVLVAGGCSPAAPSAEPPPAHNATDVMFLRMSVDSSRQGDQLTAAITARAHDPRVREIARDLDEQWAGERDLMQSWIAEWNAPSADPGLHAGHGGLHSLRPEDFADLNRTTGPAFDRAAASLLLGHLHGTVEVARLETRDGLYPAARQVAQTIVTTRQDQISELIKLTAT
jgi:uncharacterized protein (DUF305 family)